MIAYRHQSCFHFHGACVYKVLGLLCHTVIFLFRILLFFVRVIAIGMAGFLNILPGGGVALKIALVVDVV